MNLRRLTNETIIYGIGRGIEGIAAFVVLPFIGRYLVPSVFGYADVISATTGLLYLTVGLNLHQALTRYYYDLDSGTLVTTHSATFLGSGAIHLGIGAGIVLLFRGTVMEPAAWIIAITSVIGQFTSEYITTIFRMRHEPLRYLSVVFVTQSALCIATPLLLVVFDAGINAIFIGKTVAFCAGILISIGWLISVYRKRIDFEYLKRSIRFVLPMVPGNIASWALIYAPRYFLIAAASAAQVGYYGVAVRFSYMLMMVGMAGAMAWTPFAMGIKDEPHASKTLGRGLLYITFVNVAVGIIVAAFSYEGAYLLMGPDYIEAAPLIGPMMVATVFSNLMLIVFIQIAISEKTIWQSAGYAIGVIVMSVLNITLIPKYGAFGAVIATAVGHGAAATAHFTAGQRYFPVQTDVGKILGMIGVLSVIAFAGQWIEVHTDVRSIAVAWKALLTLGALGGLILILGKTELAASRTVLRGIVSRQEHRDVDSVH